MVPLYAARIEDLGPDDFVRVECIACGHNMLHVKIRAAAVSSKLTYGRI